MKLQVGRVLALTIVLAICWRVQGQSTPFDVVVARDGSGNFTTITRAIFAAPNYSPQRYYIKIKEGIYTENINIDKRKTNLVLVGDGMDNTIISGNRSNRRGFKTYETATVGIYAQGFIAQGITFQNLAGPDKNQAVALTIEATYSAFFRCRFQGYQDTLYTKRGIQFFRECEIFGTVDFIFGDASVVLQNCIIYGRKPLPGQSNTITAQGRESGGRETGIIIHNCTITAAPDLRQQESKVATYLGRPWKNFSRTVIMQSFLDALINPKGWLEWEGTGLDNVYYAECDNRGPGANTNGRVKWARVINSFTEADKFTVRNFIKGDKWIPSTRIPYFLDLL